MNLWKKILAVQKEAETIPKSGYNSYNKYAYSTEADVLKVKDLMNRHGLVAIPNTVAYETFHRADSVQVLMHIEYTIVDVETGESIRCKVLGQGEDRGDKGAYKAATGANKYFYLKFAGAPTGDDPERDEQQRHERKSPQLIGKELPASNAGAEAPAKTLGAETAAGAGLGTSAGNPTELKNKIRKLARSKGIKFKDVASIAGVGSVWESEDTGLLHQVLDSLQAS